MHSIMRLALLLELPEEYELARFLAHKKARVRVCKNAKLRRETLLKIYE